ncbi:hypothetical protein ABZY42_03610 [Streptomyces sp. NPDC006622]|uniref:hypothetical protein n=1 Tax=Streptomyces sp. NPDC006622 TaxID=3155459 RepID=UPI0033B3222A
MYRASGAGGPYDGPAHGLTGSPELTAPVALALGTTGYAGAGPAAEDLAGVDVRDTLPVVDGRL